LKQGKYKVEMREEASKWPRWISPSGWKIRLFLEGK
jgi:hypothetical protein